MDIYRGRIHLEKSPGRAILCLMSDLHLDAEAHDRELLIRDLKTAQKIGARISINGDVFDGILPSDRKRYHRAVSSANENRDDLINRMVFQAVDILKPYADQIDMISPGNHERSLLKYHHTDVTAMIVWALNQSRSPDLPPIHQGSYRGFQQYVLAFTKQSNSVFTIYRHHGRGGSAPVTGGALDLDRIRKDFEADLYWIGHKHQSIQRKFTRISMGSKGRLKVREQRAVMSAGYTRQIADEDPSLNGDIADSKRSTTCPRLALSGYSSRCTRTGKTRTAIPTVFAGA